MSIARTYVGQTALCDGCGKEKKIFSEETKDNEIVSKYCKKCHDKLHGFKG
jgi:hypothetical protein